LVKPGTSWIISYLAKELKEADISSMVQAKKRFSEHYEGEMAI